MKRITSIIAVVVATLAFGSITSAQIVMPPVDNTDVTTQPAPPPAPQVAPEPRPIPPTAPTVRPAPRTTQQIQTPPQVQPPTKSGTGHSILILGLLLIALAAIGIVMYKMFFRRDRHNPEPTDELPAPAPAPAPRPAPMPGDNIEIDLALLDPAPAPAAAPPTPVLVPFAPAFVPRPLQPPASQPAPASVPRRATPVVANDELDLDAILGGKRNNKPVPKKAGKPESKDKGKSKTASGKMTKRVIKAGRRGAKAIVIFALLFGLGHAVSASAQTGKVSKISPDGFYQGLVNQTVTIDGTDLANVSAISFGNPAITTIGVTATGTSLTTKVSVPTTTPIGRYSIKIINKDGSIVDTTSVVLYVFSRDSALVGGYVEGRAVTQIETLRKEMNDRFIQASSSDASRIEGLKKSLAADTAKVQSSVNTRLNQQDARLNTFAEAVKARLAEIAAAKNELGASISSLNARISANETAAQTATATANEASDDAELAMGLASETADKTVVIEASAIPFKKAKKETLSEGSRFVEAVKARLAEIAAAKKQ